MAKNYDDFEKWLDAQSDEVKALINDRFSALENTVKAVRAERDTFNAELRELGKKMEKGSDAEKQVAEITAKLAQAERKSSFLEAASNQGCIRPSAAYALAQSESLFSEDGKVDWKALKESVPELFKVTNQKGNAGSGTTAVKSAGATDINAAIRAAAGKFNN